MVFQEGRPTVKFSHRLPEYSTICSERGKKLIEKFSKFLIMSLIEFYALCYLQIF